MFLRHRCLFVYGLSDKLPFSTHNCTNRKCCWYPYRKEVQYYLFKCFFSAALRIQLGKPHWPAWVRFSLELAFGIVNAVLWLWINRKFFHTIICNWTKMKLNIGANERNSFSERCHSFTICTCTQRQLFTFTLYVWSVSYHQNSILKRKLRRSMISDMCVHVCVSMSVWVCVSRWLNNSFFLNTQHAIPQINSFLVRMYDARRRNVITVSIPRCTNCCVLVGWMRMYVFSEIKIAYEHESIYDDRTKSHSYYFLASFVFDQVRTFRKCVCV